MSDTRHDWQQALAATPDCIDVSRFGAPLSDAEQQHVRDCARCQSELAMFREFESDESTSDGQWIAEELRRRLQQNESETVVPFRPRTFRLAYAVAAMLVVLIGVGTWMQLREPSLDPAIDVPQGYRSARLEAIAPMGDLADTPKELRWSVVPNASRYRVRVMEVDQTVLWNGETTDSHIALPPAVVAQFAPGKSLLWDVTALHGNDILASSDTQRFRVSVADSRRLP